MAGRANAHPQPGGPLQKQTLSRDTDPRDEEFGGKKCIVYEWLDGSVEIRYHDTLLPFSVLDKNPRVPQSAIVENKRLAAALSDIKEKQEERDEKRLKSPKITKRQKRRIEQQIKASG